MHAPVALFVYNRPWHTRQTIEALQKNILAEESDLFIYSDAARNEQSVTKVREVRNYIKTISGFKSVRIIERECNLGLAQSIITGVTETVNRYGNIIVMEDDLVSSPFFLKYMNEGLSKYQNEEKVISVHGYIYPIKKKLPETFFIRGADCWGWATWKRGWDLFESNGSILLEELNQKKLIKQFNYNHSYNFTQMLRDQVKGKNDSWAIRWHASAFLKNKLTLYPNKSLIKNIGFDNTGTHSEASNSYKIDLSNQIINLKAIAIEEDIFAAKEIEEYFKSIQPILSKRIIRNLGRILNLKSLSRIIKKS